MTLLNGLLFGTKTADAPAPAAASGFRIGSYTDDFYYRIHYSPKVIAFGNVTTPQIVQVEVFNAFFGSVPISAVAGEETGLEVIDPIAVPGTMPGIASKFWTIRCTSDGPPKVDKYLIWEFGSPASPIQVRVTATRLEVWPFKPLTPLIESCEWSTAVLRPYSGEQRIAKRATPRRTFSLSHVTDQNKTARARTLARRALSYWLPDWPKAITSSNVHGGMAVDLPDGDVVVWRDWNNFEQTTVASGVLGSVSVSGPGIIAPLVVCRLTDGWANDRPAGSLSRISVTLETSESNDAGDSTFYPEWLGLPIINEPVKIGSASFNETVQQEMDIFDNGQNKPTEIKTHELSDAKFMVRWHEFTEVRKVGLRGWIASRMGKLKAFWLPSWAHDMVCKSRLPTGMLVDRYDSRELHLQIKVGASYVYRTITAAAEVVGGWQLVLDEPLPEGTVGMVSFIRKVRFDSDRVEFNYAAGAGMSVQLPVIEVPA